MGESKSVVIKLTDEQRNAIKRATGKDIGELRVDALEGRITPLVMEARKAPTGFGGDPDQQEFRKAPTLGVPAEAESRKAPTGLGEPAQQDARKAPTSVD